MHFQPSIYRISSDKDIQKLYQSLPRRIQDAIKRRDQINALRNGLSIDDYLYLISNPLNE